MARRGFVETGERRGLRIEIKKGVKAGERAVTAGQLKLDDGAPITLSGDDPLERAEPRPARP